MNSALDEYIAVPKKGSVIRSGEKFKKIIREFNFPCSFTRGELTIDGPLSSPLPNSIFPPRTLYRKIPVSNGNGEQYLEVKGYGRAGMEMYFQNHGCGDIFYGMYLINAVSEFNRMKIAYDLGLPVPLPLAVVEIPRDEYIMLGLTGFQKNIESLLSLRGIESAKIESLIGKTRNQSNAEIAKKLIEYAKQLNKGNIVDGIRFLVSRLSVHPWQGFGINDKADALFSEMRVGYLLRISKSPYRVGDPSTCIKNNKFSKIAESMGNTFRILLENRILHHCPGTGNWTQAGELTDFVDTFDLQYEEEELQSHIRNLQERGVIKTKKLEDFLKYLIGPEHTGGLCEDFLKGICGKKNSLEGAVSNLLKIIL